MKKIAKFVLATIALFMTFAPGAAAEELSVLIAEPANLLGGWQLPENGFAIFTGAPVDSSIEAPPICNATVNTEMQTLMILGRGQESQKLAIINFNTNPDLLPGDRTFTLTKVDEFGLRCQSDTHIFYEYIINVD